MSEYRYTVGGESKVPLREVPRTLLSFWWREVAFGSPWPLAPAVWAARVPVGGRVGGPIPAAGVPTGRRT